MKNLPFSGVLVLFLAGCSNLRTFTLDQYNTLGGDEGAKKLQFYVSEDTMLRRVLGSED